MLDIYVSICYTACASFVSVVQNIDTNNSWFLRCHCIKIVLMCLLLLFIAASTAAVDFMVLPVQQGTSFVQRVALEAQLLSTNIHCRWKSLKMYYGSCSRQFVWGNIWENDLT